MKPVRIYRHDEPVGAGYFLDFLKSQAIEYELIAIDQGDAVTLDFNQASGLVFLGGDSCVNDPYSWIDDEINLIQQAAAKNFPIFGHCFGAQLISKALGGTVSSMSQKEIGWFALDWAENSISQEWFSQLSNNIKAMHWHQYSLTVPIGATSLFGTHYCPNQAFVINNMIATTSHVEATAELVHEWVSVYADDLNPVSNTLQPKSEIVNDINRRVASMQLLTNILYMRWLTMMQSYNSNKQN